MAGPLEGIRVLDLSRVLAGPLSTQILSDLGAEIIKVERPDGGDETRSYPPFSDTEMGQPFYSSYFVSINRGKHSITVDLSKSEGQQIIYELADKSDIFIENFKVDGLKKLGLDYATLSARNPKLIYCSITAFGQNSKRRYRPGYDLVIQAMGGLMSITGDSNGTPMKAGVAIADTATALYATIAILAALYERKSSNRGQHIDIALLDVQIAGLLHHASSYLMTNEVPIRRGNAHVSLVPYQAFATSDGALVLAVANDVQFTRFVTVLGLPWLAADEKYRTNADRVSNREELIPIIEREFLKKPTTEWLVDLDEAEIPAGPINSVQQVFEDSQIEERQLLKEFPSSSGPIRVAGSPLNFSRTQFSSNLPPPSLGAHTNEILSIVLGKSDSEIEILKKKKVI